MTPEERFLHYEWIATKSARRLCGVLGVAYSDAVAWGSLGLWQAVHRDYKPWVSVATRRVTGAIRDGAAQWHGLRDVGEKRRTKPYSVPLVDLSSDAAAIPRADALVWEARLDPYGLAEEERSYTKLYAALAKLSEREAQVIRRHYLKGEELQQIAAELGVSPPMVSKIKRRSLVKIRELLVTA